MNLISVPSLKQIALLKVATLMWHEGHVRYFMCISESQTEPFQDENTPSSMVIERFVAEIIAKVSELQLPEPLKERLPIYIGQVGQQIMAWMNFRSTYKDDSSFDAKPCLCFCWTPYGTIDYKRTAEMLIQDKDMEVEERFKIAVVHCLENEFHVLKNKVKRVRSRYFASYFISCQREAIAKLDEKTNGFCETDAISYDECAFRYSALSGNVAATRHFLQKLSPYERDRSLVTTATYVTVNFYPFISSILWCPFVEVFVFLLSVMNEEQQTSIFRNKQEEVIGSFFKMPWQHFFLEIYDHVLPFGDGDVFQYVMAMIISHLVHCKYDENEYNRIFRIIWQKTPVLYKKFYLEHFGISFIMGNMFKNMDGDMAKLFLNGVVDIMGKECILDDLGTDICASLAGCKRLYLFKYFIEACITQDSVKRLKKELLPNVQRRMDPPLRDRNLRKTLSKIIDECIKEFKKRKYIENNKSAKQS